MVSSVWNLISFVSKVLSFCYGLVIINYGTKNWKKLLNRTELTKKFGSLQLKIGLIPGFQQHVMSKCNETRGFWKVPVSPACNCIDCMQGVTPSKTYILLLLLGQNLNWNTHSFPFMSCIFNGRPSGWEIGGKYA